MAQPTDDVVRRVMGATSYYHIFNMAQYVPSTYGQPPRARWCDAANTELFKEFRKLAVIAHSLEPTARANPLEDRPRSPARRSTSYEKRSHGRALLAPAGQAPSR